MGTTYNDSGYVTRQADGDIPKYSRVQRTATGVAAAAAGDPTYGSLTRHAYAPGIPISEGADTTTQEDVTVKLANAPGTHFAIAAGAIPEGAEIEGAADGKVAVLDGGDPIGNCEEPGGAVAPANGKNHVIQVYYYNQPV